MTQSNFRIVLFNYGLREFTEPFWYEAIVATGLEPFVDVAAQINGFSNWLYPEDMLIRFSRNDIAERQYAHTVRTLHTWNYLPSGHEFTDVLFDFEPRKPELDPADRNSTYLWKKMVEGYNQADEVAHRYMLNGVKKATDGLPIVMYRTPAVNKNNYRERQRRNIKSAKPVTDLADTVWQHAYGKGRDMLTHEYVADLTAEAADLRQLGKPLLLSSWPGYNVTPAQADRNLLLVARVVKARRDPRMGVWCEMNTVSDFEAHKANVIAAAPNLLKALGA